MNQRYPFEAFPLPYSYISLMPRCDANTLYFHHDQYYVNEVFRLNRLVEQHRLTSWSLKDLLTKEINLPIVHANRVRDSAGSVYNHQLYFDGVTTEAFYPLYSPLSEQLMATYGSFRTFYGS